MSPAENAALWYAINRVRDEYRDAAPDVKQAIFAEHFVNTLNEGETASYAKVEVAALLGNLRLKGETK